MPVVTTVLGPFELGQQPTITAVVKNLPGGTDVSLACTWTSTDPNGDVVSVSSPDSSIANPSPNVWTWLMPILVVPGIYWIRCESTAGLISAHSQQLGVTDI